MEIATSVVSEIVSKLVDATILQVRYPLRFRRYVKELETGKENLQTKIEGVLHRTNEAKRKTEKIVGEVEKWLEEAETLIAKVVELQEKAGNRKKTSCLKCCPNLIRRYSLAKQLEEKTNEIIKHTQVEFLQFSRLATLIGMNYFSSEGFLHFDSRKVAYNELLEALKDDQVRMIGLYGMGGCGKTTLAKEVGKEAEQLFDKVVFVVVSNPIDLRKIQGKIASHLGLELKDEDEPERARRLFMRLTSGERFLIILDDVWEMLNFEAIGIPVAENQTSCTNLITTRNFDVCRLMNCNRKIPLKGLNEEEAWALFQKHAGTFHDDSNTLKGLAQEISKECGGLPVAIAALASTLKEKPQVVWDEALKALKSSSLVDVEEGLQNPYTCLTLSYDNLKHEEAKSLFLLCSIFPEDYEIPIDMLAIIRIGLGLVGQFDSYQSARNQVTIAKNKLVDCCLLLEEVDEIGGTFIKIHDLVRDVALWITKKEKKSIMGQKEIQKALNEDMTMKDDTVRYLWFDKMSKFPHKLSCPELEFLYVKTKSSHGVDIKDDFFKGIEKLRVLFLESSTPHQWPILQLPMSVHLLNNLRCLILHDWLLGDISFIKSLERLESLTLRCCSIDELPKCMIQQKNLRLLYLWDCGIQRNPYEVIGRCSQLEELCFRNKRGWDWKDECENCDEFFDKNELTLALNSYYICLGECYEFLPPANFNTRVLVVNNFESCISNATIKDLMQRAKVLSLKGIHVSCRNVIPDLFQTIGGGMNELSKLSISHSNKFEYLVDTAKHLDHVGIISNLTELTINGLKHLKTLCHGQLPQDLFTKLEVLDISDCSSLEHLITDGIREIVENDSDCQRAYRSAFPKLKRLFINNCDKLEYLMPISFAQSLARLEVLDIYGSHKLKSVISQSIYDDPSPNKFHVLEFSALRELNFISVPNIDRICPENYHPTWPSLEKLSLRDSPKLNNKSINHWIASFRLRQEDHEASEDLMKAVVTPLEVLQSIELANSKVEVIFDMEGLLDNGQQVNSSLKHLSLYSLNELRHIWRGPKNYLCLQHLYRLEIMKCGNLRVIFPAFIMRSLPQLKALYINECKELERIIEEDEENQNQSNLNQVVFPNLTTIVIRHCHKLKCVFPVSTCCVLPKLKALLIEEASQLEQVFGHTTQRKKDVVPDLKYVVLSQLPRLTKGGQWIDLQTVKYMVVDKSPELALTSTIAPKVLLKILESEKEFYIGGISELESVLKNIITKETFKQIDGKESEVESSSEGERTLAQNVQKLTPLASPNFREGVKKLEDQSVIKPNISKRKGLKKTMPALEIPAAMPAFSTYHIFKQLPINSLATPPHKIPSHQAGVNEPEDQSAPEGTINVSDKNGVKGSFEGSTSHDGHIVTSLPKAHPHIQRQIIFDQIEMDIDKDIEATPMINLQALKDDNLIGLLQSMEEDYGGELPAVSITPKDELVAKALTNLEDSLKMPFKDIATSEANSLRLQTALNFLSRLSLEDGALSHELKAIIESLRQDFLGILSSFKQAFTTINKFTVLEERDRCMKEELAQRKEAAIALVSKMSKTEKFKNEAQEKEARLKERISGLEKEIQECEAELLSLGKQKKKCVAETVDFQNEFETVRKKKLELVEDQSKARQKLFQIDYKWSVLCSQFEQNIASRNLH